MPDIERLSLDSGDPDAERKQQLAELFPEAFEDGKIDIDALRDALGDIVDDGDERYAFTWPGKRDAIRQSQIPSTATLRPQKDKSVDWDDTKNIYIEGDNLEVLKLLQHSYHGKVKMIYIDPPYNTGHDFVYKDTFGDSVANYKEQAGLAGQSNPDTSGRYHSNWCSMMYPRLKLARELLTDNGLIFISIDDIELEDAKFICNEIFGKENFVDTIIWKKRYGGGAKEKYLVTLQEYILFYCKNINKLEDIEVPLDEDQAIKYYTHRDDKYPVRGPYRTHPLEAGKAMDSRPNLIYPIPAPDGSMVMPKRQWLWSKERAYRALEQGELEISKGKNGDWVVSSKQYLKDDKGRTRPGKMFSIIDDIYTQHGTNEIVDIFGNAKIFNYPKPSTLIERLIDIADSEADDYLVLDFFAGSSTTAHAIMHKNFIDSRGRRYILVQMPEECPEKSDAHKAGFNTISDIGEERIRRVGNAIVEQYKTSNSQQELFGKSKKLPDVGFRVFSLDESGIRRPEAPQSGTLFDAGTLFDNVVKPGRTDEDIIFEMMLKWGLDLSLPIEKVDAAGYPCYSVACGELVCCMADGLTMEALEAIAGMEPRRVLMLDSILTDTLKLNAIQVFRRVGERTGVEVELRTV